MFPTELVYVAAGMPLDSRSFPVTKGRCTLCKKAFHGDAALSTKDVIKPTFTNRDLLDPRSPHICAACAYCLKEPKLRRKDFLATADKLQFIQRSDLMNILLRPPKPPFVLCVGLSHKKHLVIRARVNVSTALFYVQFEEQGIWVQPKKHKQLAFSIQALRRAFTKSAIETGNYFPGAKISAEEIFELENIVKPYRGSSVFKLFLHASQSPKPKEVKKKNGKNKVGPR